MGQYSGEKTKITSEELALSQGVLQTKFKGPDVGVPDKLDMYSYI